MLGLKLNIFGDDAPARRQATEGSWGAYRSARASSVATGLAARTRIATAMGWRPVEAIAEGDLVLTFDRGLQPVRAVIRGQQWSDPSPMPPTLWPLHVPAGALGNQDDMLLMPEQAMLVESDTAEILFGDPFALILGADLDGFRGIERVHPEVALGVVQLHFDHDEIVFAEGGALVYCPSVRAVQVAGMLDGTAGAGYRTLPSDEAEMLIDCLVDEDAVAVARPAPVPPAAASMAYAAAFA